MAEYRRVPLRLPDFPGTPVLIVEARYYDDIADQLLTGAQDALEKVGATFDVLTVPGALEIASAIAIACDRAEAAGRPYAAAVALGCIIRGDTYHFEIVANESARGLTDLALAERLPIGNGILTCDTDEQARVRADPAQGNKGGDAAWAALSLVAIKATA